jgi:hypothetical protein
MPDIPIQWSGEFPMTKEMMSNPMQAALAAARLAAAETIAAQWPEATIHGLSVHMQIDGGDDDPFVYTFAENPDPLKLSDHNRRRLGTLLMRSGLQLIEFYMPVDETE